MSHRLTGTRVPADRLARFHTEIKDADRWVDPIGDLRFEVDPEAEADLCLHAIGKISFQRSRAATDQQDGAYETERVS